MEDLIRFDDGHSDLNNSWNRDSEASVKIMVAADRSRIQVTGRFKRDQKLDLQYNSNPKFYSVGVQPSTRILHVRGTPPPNS